MDPAPPVSTGFSMAATALPLSSTKRATLRDSFSKSGNGVSRGAGGSAAFAAGAASAAGTGGDGVASAGAAGASLGALAPRAGRCAIAGGAASACVAAQISSGSFAEAALISSQEDCKPLAGGGVSLEGSGPERSTAPPCEPRPRECLLMDFSSPASGAPPFPFPT